MTRVSTFRHFALYGETERPIAPEFMHIEPISQRSRLHEWTIAPHAHRGIHQLLLVEAGGGILATDGEEAHLEAGSLIFLPGGCVHAFRFAPDAEGWVLSLATELLNDPRISALCEDLRSGTDGARWLRLQGETGAPYTRLSWLMADLAAVLTGDRSGILPNAVVAQIALILAVAAGELAQAGHAAINERNGNVARRYGNLVERHLRDGWAVADYAARLGTTSPTLTRSCRRVLGRAPGEMILDRLLLEAMRRLTYSTASVSQIAGDLGFADTAYFARFFKARCGMTASTFRRQRAWFSGAIGERQAAAAD